MIKNLKSIDDFGIRLAMPSDEVVQPSSRTQSAKVASQFLIKKGITSSRIRRREMVAIRPRLISCGFLVRLRLSGPPAARFRTLRIRPLLHQNVLVKPSLLRKRSNLAFVHN